MTSDYEMAQHFPVVQQLISIDEAKKKGEFYQESIVKSVKLSNDKKFLIINEGESWVPNTPGMERLIKR